MMKVIALFISFTNLELMRIRYFIIKYNNISNIKPFIRMTSHELVKTERWNSYTNLTFSTMKYCNFKNK